MIKDLLVSFRDNLKEKTTNPFLGTYAIVWIFRNWELIYSLIYFDQNLKLTDRLSFIKDYYTKHDFIINLLTNIYWSIGVLIVTYSLLNVSRFIVNLYEKRLTPWIYKMTDSKSIVLKSEYERVRTDRDELQVRLDRERESKSRLETRIKSLENEIINISENNSKFKKNGNENGSKNKKISENDELHLILQKLKENKQLKDFKDTAVMINKNDSISNDYKPKDDFIALGLIKYDPLSNAGIYAKKYLLTKDGEELLKLARFE